MAFSGTMKEVRAKHHAGVSYQQQSGCKLQAMLK